MARFGDIVAGLGALAGGYVKGRQIHRENEWEDEERAQKRQEWADKEAIRAAMAGGTPDRNAALMTNSATDLADVDSASAGGTTPRSAEIKTIQRVGTNLTSDSAFTQSMADAENFATGADEGLAPKTEPTAAYRVKGVGVYGDPADAIAASQQAGEDTRLGAVQQGTKRPDTVDFLPQYLERIAPRVQAEYLRQGKVAEAKAFQDLLDSQEGKVYTKNWTNAVRKIEMGDLDGAVPDLAKLYTSYPDGRRAQAKKLDGGKYQIDMIDEATGETVETATLESGDLVRKAAMALRPEKMAEFMATQEGKRTAEAASLDKSLEVERVRQEGRDAQDDRREERLGMRLDAQDKALERRLAAKGGLTAAQQRANAEIDAAREAVAGMSPQDIARRTAKATNTGRENPDYDPGLARQAALAGRRKVGDDELFDSPKPKPAAAAFDRTDVAKRFRADKTMLNRTLGKETQHGVEVLQNGKLIGYFQ